MLLYERPEAATCSPKFHRLWSYSLSLYTNQPHNQSPTDLVNDGTFLLRSSKNPFSFLYLNNTFRKETTSRYISHASVRWNLRAPRSLQCYSYREKNGRWSTLLNLYGYHSLGTAYYYLFYNLFTEL